MCGDDRPSCSVASQAYGVALGINT